MRHTINVGQVFIISIVPSLRILATDVAVGLEMIAKLNEMWTRQAINLNRRVNENTHRSLSLTLPLIVTDRHILWGCTATQSYVASYLGILAATLRAAQRPSYREVFWT